MRKLSIENKVSSLKIIQFKEESNAMPIKVRKEDQGKYYSPLGMFHMGEALLNQVLPIVWTKKNVIEHFLKFPLTEHPFWPPQFFFLLECGSENEK